MAGEGSSVCGGVTLSHTEQEGKHLYEVKNFLSYNKEMFARKGDKILMINGLKTEDLTPKKFADILIKGSPSLTILHPYKEKTQECASEEIRPYKKEVTVMGFNLAMVREEDLESGGHQEPPHSDPEWDIRDIQDVTLDDNLLLISMAVTSFSLVVARGPSSDNPDQVNEVVVMPERAQIAFNSEQIAKLFKERNNLFLKSFYWGKYVTPWNDQIHLKDTMSEKITIYYYIFSKTEPFAGCPVLLNFTGTNNFFSCTSKGEVKILTVTSHRRSELKNICEDDREKWSLVFYMSSAATGLRRFESALYRGWFIYTVGCDVKMQKQSLCDDIQTFQFLIESEV